jgi:plastocyanin
MSYQARKKQSRPARVRVLLIGALSFITACGAGSEAVAQSLGGSTKPVVVGLKTLKFTPSKVTVKVAQRVDFKWNEGVAHNVVFDSKRKSKTVSKTGTLWSTTFDKTGIFKYKCTLHPGMQGQVTVVK